MERIDAFLTSEIAVGSFPGAAYALGTVDGIEQQGAFGHAVVYPERITATSDTIYDCASITKPLITTTLVMQAVAEGKLDLEGNFEGFALRDLLTHTSGLAAWLPLYAFERPYVESILEKGRQAERATRVVYSDLNFVLLWEALKRVYGDFIALAGQRIFSSIEDATFLPPASLRSRIAATEWRNWHERKMCADRKIVFDGFRDGMIWGETHDGNSHYAGGTAGNAGLFATARAVFRIAQGWLDGSLVPAELLREATRNYTADFGEHRGLGWQLSFPGHAATGMLSPDAFGHTGFTGTSVWVDQGRIMVLLTNRVHPCAAPVAMQRIRGEFHRLALKRYA